MGTYTVVLIPEPEEGGYSVTFPAVPGLFTQGETIDEALANARDALAFHLEALREEGESLPQERAIITTVQMPEVA